MFSRRVSRFWGVLFCFGILPLSLAENMPAGHQGNGGSNVPLITDLKGFIDQLNTNSVFSASRAKCASGATFKNGKRVGRMSSGYFYGMMLTFANAACKVKEGKDGDLYSAILTSSAGSNSRKDTFVHNRYQQSLQGDPLVQNYSLLLSLGMLESSGMYNEGIDRSASNTNGITTEAGLFQVSYNSVNASQVPKRIYDELMTKYGRGQDGVACMTGIFKMDQRLSKNTKSFGSGAALEFQNAMKSCPAMAAEYMSILLRRDVNHNGPLKREEAQPSAECSAALTEVKKVAEANCGNLSAIARSQPPAAEMRFEVAADRKLDYDFAKKRGGSTLGQMEDELEQLKAERANATTDAERAALDEQIKSVESKFAEAQKNPELLKEREAIDQKNNEAIKADQIKSEQLLQNLSKENGYMERSPQEVKQLGEEAKKLDETARAAEALAQEERKKPRPQQNREILETAKKARESATTKENEYIKAKQTQELQKNVNEREVQLQGAAVDSMKKVEAALESDVAAVDAKKQELSTAKKEREARGEQTPSEKEKQLSTELGQLEAKRDASQAALVSARELRQSLEDIRKEFPIPDRDPVDKEAMIPRITEQLKVLEQRIASIDPNSTKSGDKDRLLLLQQLHRKLRAELKYYKLLN